MYVVTYAHDPRTGDGFVYLPGRGEDGYWLNASSILRPSGRWHRAAPRWSRAVNAQIP
jgi:hypothetical protein